MIYVINGKPYVKVSTYYKEVKIEKKGKEIMITPVKGGDETKVVRPKESDVISMKPIDFLTKNKGQKENVDNMLLD